MSTPDDIGDEEFTDLDQEDELSGLEQIDKIDELPDSEDTDTTTEDEESDEGSTSTADDSDDLDDDDAPEEEEESLDVILAREQDLEEEFATVGEAPRSSPTNIPAGEDEFTCLSCFLVKRQAQLADPEEQICFDCV
ncbi:DUF4193 family protein [Egibacter rhizosphaerae]|uniref:DUF4193 family protein n=1 Tax=Egibacter rhizosphaerae TaxID=1670831 RepID=A0A411YKJ0_9ACTN|nr:DUF4193 family protein [Egibacter rhizosphaerae]QBI21706.1 DUF4193 family protein [Egibacter rhizosphaerae]